MSAKAKRLARIVRIRVLEEDGAQQVLARELMRGREFRDAAARGDATSREQRTEERTWLTAENMPQMLLSRDGGQRSQFSARVLRRAAQQSDVAAAKLLQDFAQKRMAREQMETLLKAAHAQDSAEQQSRQQAQADELAAQRHYRATLEKI